MTDPVSYAQITTTQLEDGSVQYDIIPHDQTEEGAIILLNRDGVLSIRDEDGEYQAIAGTQDIHIGEYNPLGLELFEELLDMVPADVQQFEDLESNVSISLSRNDSGSLVVEVETGNDTREQFIGAIPKENVGFESRSLIVDDQIGIGTTSTSPGGVNPSDVPPSFKI